MENGGNEGDSQTAMRVSPELDDGHTVEGGKCKMQNEEGEGKKERREKEMGNPPACNWISRRFVVFARLFTYFFTTRHRHSPPRPPNDVCAV